MYVELQVENKRSNVKRLVVRTQAVIGRQSHCDIRVVSTEISREHCRIEIQEEQAFLFDLGSTNGTFLNRKRVEPQKPTPLQDGDIILVGPACFIVHLIESRLTEETNRPGDETHVPERTSQLLIDDADEPPEANRRPDAPSSSAQPSEEDPSLELSDELQDLLNSEDDDHLPQALLAGVTSDSDMEAISEDDAFDKYLKGL